MKRTLAILIALMMVLSTSIFAAPAMVSMETALEAHEIISEEFKSDAALSANEETIHDEYGYLLYNLDFETDADYSKTNKVSAHGFVNEEFSISSEWSIGGPGSTTKVTEDGNSFIRFNNTTGQYSQFHIQGNNKFTDENGYYTVIADVRYISGGSGAELKDFSIRSNVGDKANHTLGNTLPTGSFTTSVVQYKNVGTTTPLSRTSLVFEYKTAPTVTGVDKFDVDNIKLYYKPVKTTVKILGDESLSIADMNVEITPADDSYVVTKSELMALVNVPDNAILLDLTLADGTAFETVDLDVVKAVKAVYRTYEIYDDTYGHLIYNLDFETDADYAKANKASAHGFVNEPFCPTSSDWHIGGSNMSKFTEGGNSFARMKNGTSQWPQLQVYSNGQFTDENGYYTIVADVRYTANGSGAELNAFWIQGYYEKTDASYVTEGGRSSFTNFGSDFATVAIHGTPRRDEGIKLITMKYVYEYKSAPTVANKDYLDLDNIRLYFKPFSKNVTVLAGDNAEFEDQNINVTINLDLNSTITKEKLMALVENNTDMILSDLTLADGTAFEEIDVMKVNEVKAVWKSRAPQSHDGASIRVIGPSGIRFRASVTNEQKALAVEYGFVVTLEKHLKGADMTTLTLESENKVVGVSYGYDPIFEKNVDRIFDTDDDNIFFTAVVYGLPATKSAYNEPIIVRPYLKDDKGTIYYSTPIKRSIIQVARAIRDGGYSDLDTEGVDFVKGILTICGENV